MQVLAGIAEHAAGRHLQRRRRAAVGLTGADATVAPVGAAPPFTAADGGTVTWDASACRRPRPAGAAGRLAAAGFVPVVASVSASKAGALFNVNADTLAGNLAARLKARRLVVAGNTAGVLDAAGARPCRWWMRRRRRRW